MYCITYTNTSGYMAQKRTDRFGLRLLLRQLRAYHCRIIGVLQIA